MDLRSIFNREARAASGFTLIETLVATGIIVMLLTVGLVLTLADYRAGNSNREVETIVTLLQVARSKAMNNINGVPHGVVVHPPEYLQSYVLFEGASYEESVAVDIIAQAYSFRVDNAPVEIVFAQLSGSVANPASIVLADDERGMSRVIMVNAEGGIDW